MTDQSGSWQRAAQMVKDGTVPRISPAGVAGFKPAEPGEAAKAIKAANDAASSDSGGTATVTGVISDTPVGDIKAGVEPEDLSDAKAGTGSSEGNSDAEDG